MDLGAENLSRARPAPPDSELKGAALLTALGLASSAGSAACASGEVVEIHEFAGAIADTDIFLGVLFGTVRGELVGVAYACDGDSISEWFGISGGSTDTVEYISPEGGTMTATVSDTELNGRVRLSSRTAYDFSLGAVKPGQGAGLYVSNWHTGATMNHTEQDRWIIGRIVLNG